MKPNAQTHLPPKAGARHERRLAAVRCSAMFGWRCAVEPPRACTLALDTVTLVGLPDALAPSPHRHPLHAYLSTSSAWKRTNGGSVTPRASAVFRLITSANCVGRATGRSAGRAPLRSLSTWAATRRDSATTL